ncbi:MAG TPA: 3D domain-containing protein [Pyrinomonadaceae bacterium]|jgi:3D (Asp-Asp-Asp) domain-containing protein
MKMFFGGSAAFAATLLASSVLFHARPLFAETPASQQPASIEQQKKESIEAAPAQSAQEAETRNASEPAAAAAPESAPVVGAAGTVTPPGSVSSKTAAEAPAPAATAATPAAEAITAPQAYVATAYSLPGKTASGMRVAKGVIAADPRVLPLGTRVRLDAGPYSGEYIVADTGSAVRGRKIDVWVPSYREACRFGRRNIRLSVLSYGGRRAATTARNARRAK